MKELKIIIIGQGLNDQQINDIQEQMLFPKYVILNIVLS